jgi:mannose-6-phosphate isomerase
MLALDNPIQNYAWGSTTALAELMGRTATGKPEAELWIGAHPKAPSRLSDGRSLLEGIQSDTRGTLGDAVSAEFDGRLPFLLKVLAVATPLSLQAHPNLAQARDGFAREERAHVPLSAPERNYKDANHKPELLCALGPFEALSGFRAPAQAIAALQELGLERSELAHKLAASEAEPLRFAFDYLMSLQGEQRARCLTEIVTASARAAESHSPFAASYRWVVTLAEYYPGDIGAACSLLLNYLALEPFEAVYLEAGRLHAYLKGVGVELMANSDNVLRGGLTPKHVDVAELTRVLRFDDQLIQPTPTRVVDGGEVQYRTPAREFALSRIELDGAPSFVAHANGPELLLCTRGSVEVSALGSSAVSSLPTAASLRLRRGASCFIPAALGGYTIAGRGQVFRASVGQRG